MSTFNESKNSFNGLLNTSWEIWDFLKEKAGLKVEAFANLSMLPPEVKFPTHIKDIIRYDKNKKRLIYNKVMSEEEKKELLKLSANKEYQNAIEALFLRSQQSYDLGIFEELCKRLNISPYGDIRSELQKKNISPELFIGAFLKAIQPYAQMMVDLCIFFYLHGVKRTNKEMKILFDFGKGPEDLNFDLKHFRETLWKYRKISQYVTIYGWNQNTLWSLGGIFRDLWLYSPQNLDAKDWLSNYDENKKFSFPFPILPTTGAEEIDLWLQKTWQVWETIILECRKYGPNRDDLKECAETQYKERSDIDEERKESYESIRCFQELPHFEEWDARALYSLDSDRWPESMLRGIFGFTEKIIKIPETERMEEAQHTIQQIQKLFSELPHWKGEREVLIKEFLELLNLPIWNKRPELYQTWILSQIDKALDDYQRVVHHVNGALMLRFSGTHIATIETEKGRIHIWSELRSPLANPLGKGRKGHIQPDYSLTFEPVTDPSQTVIAIECKQYRKANPKKFADALIDYSRGRPNAKVLLVNYGDMITEKIVNQIDKDLKARTLTIGNFMPGRLKEIGIFKQSLLESLPKSIAKREEEETLKKMQFDLIAVDISGSMEEALTEQRVLRILNMIIKFSPNAKLIAIDTMVKNEWEKAEQGISQLLDLPRKANTDLPAALTGYNLGKAVVLTDEDGWKQLSDIDNPPCLVIEVESEKTLYFHFRDRERKKAMLLEELENDPNPYKDFKKEYISDIKNPAYVVEEETRSIGEGKIITGGLVVAWNEGFERLANFTPSDIEYKSCHELFRAVRWNDKVDEEINLPRNSFDFKSFKENIESIFRDKIECKKPDLIINSDLTEEEKKELQEYQEQLKNLSTFDFYSFKKDIENHFRDKIKCRNPHFVFKDVLTETEKKELQKYLKDKSFYDNEITKILKKSECTKRWLQICSEDCAIRKKDPAEAGVIKKLWINSKDLKGGDIKKCVDVFIFPFIEEGKKCALHILSSKEEAYSHRYFSEVLIRETKRSVNIEDKCEIVDCSYFPIKENDIYEIQNPAYVVKAKLKEGKKGEEKEKERGCVVAWNEEFERLTNFTPSDIDYKWCDRLFDGCWESKNNWQQICIEACPIRRKNKPVVIRDFWINSKDQRGGDIKRRVDVFVFPFKREQNIFTLHILLDTEIAHDYQYFLKDIAERI